MPVSLSFSVSVSSTQINFVRCQVFFFSIWAFFPFCCCCCRCCFAFVLFFCSYLCILLAQRLNAIKTNIHDSMQEVWLFGVHFDAMPYFMVNKRPQSSIITIKINPAQKSTTYFFPSYYLFFFFLLVCWYRHRVSMLFSNFLSLCPRRKINEP